MSEIIKGTPEVPLTEEAQKLGELSLSQEIEVDDNKETWGLGWPD